MVKDREKSLEALTKSLTVSKTSNATLTTQLSVTQGDLVLANAKLASLQTSLSQEQQQLAATRAELETAKAKIAELEAKALAVQAEHFAAIQGMQNEAGRLTAELAAEAQAKRQLEQQYRYGAPPLRVLSRRARARRDRSSIPLSQQRGSPGGWRRVREEIVDLKSKIRPGLAGVGGVVVVGGDSRPGASGTLEGTEPFPPLVRGRGRSVHRAVRPSARRFLTRRRLATRVWMRSPFCSPLRIARRRR